MAFIKAASGYGERTMARTFGTRSPVATESGDVVGASGRGWVGQRSSLGLPERASPHV